MNIYVTTSSIGTAHRIIFTLTITHHDGDPLHLEDCYLCCFLLGWPTFVLIRRRKHGWQSANLQPEFLRAALQTIAGFLWDGLNVLCCIASAGGVPARWS